MCMCECVSECVCEGMEGERGGENKICISKKA